MGRRCLTLALLVVPAIVGAQSLELSNGTWVRLRANTLRGQHEAVVSNSSADTLHLALDIGGPPLPIALRDMQWLEVRRGRPHARRNAIRGGVAGATVFGILGGLLGIIVQQCALDDICDSSTGERVAVVGGAAAGGAVIGAVIGGYLGSLTAPQRWEVLIDRTTPPRPNR